MRILGIACCLFLLVSAPLFAGSPAVSIDRMLSSFGPEEHRAAAGMVTVASCTGPGGAFTTEVISVRPDVTLFTQRSDRGVLRLLVTRGRVWSVPGDGQAPAPADPAARAFVRQNYQWSQNVAQMLAYLHDVALRDPDGEGGRARPDGQRHQPIVTNVK